MSSQANQPLPEGFQLENYRILRLLASGGFSFVYLAHDENEVPVAVKEYLPASLALRTDANPLPVVPEQNLATFRYGLKCFFEEGRALAMMSHPNVVRVLSVSCTAVTKDDASGEELPSYLAKVRLVEVKKGGAAQGDEVLVTWRAIPKGIVGPWAVYYYPGEVVLTHLVKKSGGVAYGSTWWNAKGDDITAPQSTELPSTPGETFDAPQGGTDQHPL